MQESDSVHTKAESWQNSTELNVRLLTSYGAMTILLSFLTANNATKIQGLNRFFYQTAVGRVQTKRPVPKPKIFFKQFSDSRLFVWD